jgi:hypothetical protein
MEFYPTNGSLLGLNVNGGARIMIRLRPSHNRHEFLPWESLLGTLVHELVHNAIGEHSYDFYQMVDSLGEEVQRDMLQLRVSGVNPYEIKANLPFDWSKSTGHRLGGGNATTISRNRGCGSIQDYILPSSTQSNERVEETSKQGKQLQRGKGKTNAILDERSNKNIDSTVTNKRTSSSSSKPSAALPIQSSNRGTLPHDDDDHDNHTETTVNAMPATGSREWLRQQRLAALAKQGALSVSSSAPRSDSSARSEDRTKNQAKKEEKEEEAEKEDEKNEFEPQRKRQRIFPSSLSTTRDGAQHQQQLQLQLPLKLTAPATAVLDVIDLSAASPLPKQPKSTHEPEIVLLSDEDNNDDDDEDNRNDLPPVWPVGDDGSTFCPPCSNRLVIDLVNLGLEGEDNEDVLSDDE